MRRGYFYIPGYTVEVREWMINFIAAHFNYLSIWRLKSIYISKWGIWNSCFGEFKYDIWLTSVTVWSYPVNSALVISWVKNKVWVSLFIANFEKKTAFLGVLYLISYWIR